MEAMDLPMSEIVNLKRFRKKATRDQSAAQAQSQRARFGRTRAERVRDEEHKRKVAAALDQHRVGEDKG